MKAIPTPNSSQTLVANLHTGLSMVEVKVQILQHVKHGERLFRQDSWITNKKAPLKLTATGIKEQCRTNAKGTVEASVH